MQRILQQFSSAAVRATNSLPRALLKRASITRLFAAGMTVALPIIANAQSYANVEKYRAQLTEYQNNNPFLSEGDRAQLAKNWEWVVAQEKAEMARRNNIHPFQVFQPNTPRAATAANYVTPAYAPPANAGQYGQTNGALTSSATPAVERIVRFNLAPDLLDHFGLPADGSRYQYATRILPDGRRSTPVFYKIGPDNRVTEVAAAGNHDQLDRRAQAEPASVERALNSRDLMNSAETGSDPRTLQLASLDSSATYGSTTGASARYGGRVADDVAAIHWAEQHAIAGYDRHCWIWVQRAGRVAGLTLQSSQDLWSSGLFEQVDPRSPPRDLDIAHLRAPGQAGHYAIFLGEWFSGPFQTNSKGRPTVFPNDAYAAANNVTILRPMFTLLSEINPDGRSRTMTAMNSGTPSLRQGHYSFNYGDQVYPTSRAQRAHTRTSRAVHHTVSASQVSYSGGLISKLDLRNVAEQMPRATVAVHYEKLPRAAAPNISSLDLNKGDVVLGGEKHLPGLNLIAWARSHRTHAVRWHARATRAWSGRHRTPPHNWRSHRRAVVHSSDHIADQLNWAQLYGSATLADANMAPPSPAAFARPIRATGGPMQLASLGSRSVSPTAPMLPENSALAQQAAPPAPRGEKVIDFYLGYQNPLTGYDSRSLCEYRQGTVFRYDPSTRTWSEALVDPALKTVLAEEARNNPASYIDWTKNPSVMRAKLQDYQVKIDYNPRRRDLMRRIENANTTQEVAAHVLAYVGAHNFEDALKFDPAFSNPMIRPVIEGALGDIRAQAAAAARNRKAAAAVDPRIAPSGPVRPAAASQPQYIGFDSQPS